MATSKKPRQPASPPANKREAFLKLGEKRMTKAIKAIRLLGNLAGRAYEYNDDDVKKMRGALTAAVNMTLERFEAKGEKKAETFSFQQ